MNLIKLFLIGSVASALIANPASADVKWIAGANKSCFQICYQEAYQPFASGKYTNGETFYVCSANAGGEGFRAGYNLAPTWDHQCVVGYGGKELSVNKFSCLCSK